MSFVVFFQEFRQLAQGGLFAPLFPHLLCRYAENSLARLNVLVDSGSGQDHGTRTDNKVFIDTYTTTKDDIVLDARHTSDGGMGTNKAVVANVTVVTNLAVVVEFGATLDDGV